MNSVSIAQRHRTALFALAVGLIALALFHPVRHFAFLNFDDDLYVENNPWLKQGITWESLRWAFTANLFQFSIRAEYWSPFTLLTRLFDGEFFGMNAGAHHVTSAVLHALNAILLFAALRSLTLNWGRSAAVALLWLTLPLNVEPVAWLSSRKDLVSAAFFFLTLAAYGRYARDPSKRSYLLVAAAFCGGLMSKPMVVTIPALMLVLDGWPLGRWKAARGNREAQIKLVAEKIPLFLLAGIIAFIAVLGQKDWGALQSTGSYPLHIRAGNAVVSYITFVRRVFWPDDLALFYPHPGAAISWQAVAVSGFVLVMITLAVLVFSGRRYLFTGWFWFLGILVPVIGLVQIGNQAMADRYAYPSIVGILLMLVWGVADILAGRTKLAGVLLAAAVAGSAVISGKQLTHWRDSEAAFTRAIAVTRDNDTAHLNLGNAYFVKGEHARARTHFEKSLALRPAQANGWNNLGAVEAALGNDKAAIRAYLIAIRVKPDAPKSHLYLGKLLLKNEDLQAAERCFRRANELERGWAEPYAELARLFRRQGKKKEAIEMINAWLVLRPNDPEALALLSSYR